MSIYRMHDIAYNLLPAAYFQVLWCKSHIRALPLQHMYTPSGQLRYLDLQNKLACTDSTVLVINNNSIGKLVTQFVYMDICVPVFKKIFQFSIHYISSVHLGYLGCRLQKSIYRMETMHSNKRLLSHSWPTTYFVHVNKKGIPKKHSFEAFINLIAKMLLSQTSG